MKVKYGIMKVRIKSDLQESAADVQLEIGMIAEQSQQVIYNH